ncbi:uncharacterized protein [Nicotiana tomentosiformis]|uniref:uncharacterized protein n=1 Tax=Nicotiana tomentosiformis TaxID=4098 RepID=UPI00388C5BDA
MIFGGNEINGITFSAAKKIKVSVTHSKRLWEPPKTTSPLWKKMPMKFNQHHSMESAGTSQTNWKHHSGKRDPLRVQLSEISKDIACDNEPQFIGSKVTKFLEELKTKRITSSPYHPSANGQAESTNKVIIQNLKKRLEAAKGKWPEELLGVLWAYRTTAKSSTGETPFSFVYGAEALIPVKVVELTLRYFRMDNESNNDAMLVNLELLDKHRDLAHIRIVAQKQRLERYYNRRANLRYFKVGDLVLRKVTQNTRELNAGKLGPMWEGPYRV